MSWSILCKLSMECPVCSSTPWTLDSKDRSCCWSRAPSTWRPEASWRIRGIDDTICTINKIIEKYQGCRNVNSTIEIFQIYYFFYLPTSKGTKSGISLSISRFFDKKLMRISSAILNRKHTCVVVSSNEFVSCFMYNWSLVTVLATNICKK